MEMEVKLDDNDDTLKKELERLLLEYGSEELLGELGFLLQRVDESVGGHTLRKIGIAIEALAEIEY